MLHMSQLLGRRRTRHRKSLNFEINQRVLGSMVIVFEVCVCTFKRCFPSAFCRLIIHNLNDETLSLSLSLYSKATRAL